MEPTALVVEDSPEWLRLLCDELLAAGFKIDWATSHDEALRKISAPLFTYGLVVLDPNLDDSLRGLSGRHIADLLVSSPGHCPLIVLVSGYGGRKELLEEYAQFGPTIHDAFEKNSFDLSRFRAMLFELLGVNDHSEALFRPDRRALQAAWRRVLDSEDADERGRSLEAFTIELLSSIALLQFARPRTRGATNEVDAVFRVAAVPGTLCQEWGGHLLVECRNRMAKFDAGAVSAFADKLDAADARVGIVVSLAGVTGKDGRDARGQIARTFDRKRRLVLVLDEDDIVDILEEGANLYAMLQRKDTDLRLGRA